jgi:DNA-binding response OmpR family regulator
MVAIPSVDLLVVEDDRSLSEQLLHSLRDKDRTRDFAADVVEAKRLLARRTYRVVVLDLVLPDGTGFDVLDSIRVEKRSPMHLVVLTADASQLVHLDRSAVKTVMFKPLDVERPAGYVQLLTRDRSSG